MKLLLFDIDGTLLRSGPAPKIAFNQAFLEIFDIPSAWGTTKAHGNTDLRITEDIALRTLKRPLTQSEYIQLCSRYVALLQTELQQCNSFRLLPGVRKLCKTLHAHPNVALGLETGNLEASGRLKLERGEINQFFSFGGFGSDSGQRSEIVALAIERGKRLHPTSSFPSDSIFVIGDAPQDIAAGKANKLQTIAVATGLSSKQELAQENPSYLLSDLSDGQGFLDLIGA